MDGTKQLSLHALLALSRSWKQFPVPPVKSVHIHSSLRLSANCCRYRDFQKSGCLPETWQIWIVLTCQTTSCNRSFMYPLPGETLTDLITLLLSILILTHLQLATTIFFFSLNSVISNPSVSHFHWPVDRKRLFCMWRWSRVSACQLGWHRSAWDHPHPHQGCWCCHSYSLSGDRKHNLNPCGQDWSPNTLHSGSSVSSLPWLSSTLLSASWPLTSPAAQRAPANQNTACFE